MEQISIFLDRDVLVLIQIVLVALICLFAFGKTFIYLINEFRKGNPNIQEVILDASDRFLKPIEDSFVDEWIEEGYVKLQDEKLKKAVEFVLDALDPATDTTASDARKRWYQFLSDVTDGDAAT